MKKKINIYIYIYLQSQANYDDNYNSKKNLNIVEDGANGVQVGDIEQQLSRICFK